MAIALPSLAAAAEVDTHHGHAGPTPEQWKMLAFTIANFAIFAFLMYRLARTPLRDYLVNRRRRLVESMAEAARLKEEAERLKREYEQKAAALDQAREELIAEIRAIAEADSKRSLASAEQAAERMRSDVERTAQSDLERARQELRQEAARLAEEIARDELQRRMTDQDRRRLLKEFLTRVERG
jgi:F-type H+-transporting ATPase subunit b